MKMTFPGLFGMIVVYAITFAACMPTALSHAYSDSHHGNASNIGFAEFKLEGVGQVALLFSFDKSGTITSVFVPPQFVAVHEQQKQNSGDIEFISDSFADGRHFVFHGNRSAEGIVGELELQPKQDGHPIYSAHLTLNYFAPELSSAEGDHAFKHYSNAQFIAESGDVVGTEIWLASTGKKKTGFIVFYESYWGEPVQVALAMQNIVRKGNIIEFNLQAPTEAHYKLFLLSHKVKLFKESNSESKKDGIILRTAPFLGKE